MPAPPPRGCVFFPHSALLARPIARNTAHSVAVRDSAASRSSASSRVLTRSGSMASSLVSSLYAFAALFARRRLSVIIAARLGAPAAALVTCTISASSISFSPSTLRITSSSWYIACVSARRSHSRCINHQNRSFLCVRTCFVSDAAAPRSVRSSLIRRTILAAVASIASSSRAWSPIRLAPFPRARLAAALISSSSAALYSAHSSSSIGRICVSRCRHPSAVSASSASSTLVRSVITSELCPLRGASSSASSVPPSMTPSAPIPTRTLARSNSPSVRTQWSMVVWIAPPSATYVAPSPPALIMPVHISNASSHSSRSFAAPLPSLSRTRAVCACRSPVTACSRPASHALLCAASISSRTCVVTAARTGAFVSLLRTGAYTLDRSISVPSARSLMCACCIRPGTFSYSESTSAPSARRSSGHTSMSASLYQMYIPAHGSSAGALDRISCHPSKSPVVSSPRSLSMRSWSPTGRCVSCPHITDASAASVRITWNSLRSACATSPASSTSTVAARRRVFALRCTSSRSLASTPPWFSVIITTLPDAVRRLRCASSIASAICDCVARCHRPPVRTASVIAATSQSAPSALARCTAATSLSCVSSPSCGGRRGRPPFPPRAACRARRMCRRARWVTSALCSSPSASRTSHRSSTSSAAGAPVSRARRSSSPCSTTSPVRYPRFAATCSRFVGTSTVAPARRVGSCSSIAQSVPAARLTSVPYIPFHRIRSPFPYPTTSTLSPGHQNSCSRGVRSVAAPLDVAAPSLSVSPPRFCGRSPPSAPSSALSRRSSLVSHAPSAPPGPAPAVAVSTASTSLIGGVALDARPPPPSSVPPASGGGSLDVPAPLRVASISAPPSACLSPVPSAPSPARAPSPLLASLLSSSLPPLLPPSSTLRRPPPSSVSPASGDGSLDVPASLRAASISASSSACPPPAPPAPSPARAPAPSLASLLSSSTTLRRPHPSAARLPVRTAISSSPLASSCLGWGSLAASICISLCTSTGLASAARTILCRSCSVVPSPSIPNAMRLTRSRSSVHPSTTSRTPTRSKPASLVRARHLPPTPPRSRIDCVAAYVPASRVRRGSACPSTPCSRPFPSVAASCARVATGTSRLAAYFSISILSNGRLHAHVPASRTRRAVLRAAPFHAAPAPVCGPASGPALRPCAPHSAARRPRCPVRPLGACSSCCRRAMCHLRRSPCPGPVARRPPRPSRSGGGAQVALHPAPACPSAGPVSKRAKCR